jgi:hypothetical protein
VSPLEEKQAEGHVLIQINLLLLDEEVSNPGAFVC